MQELSIGDKIREYRERADISQKKLGLSLGLSDKAISAYESGRTLPPIETLYRIADELDVSIKYLLSDGSFESNIDEKLHNIEKDLNRILRELATIKRYIDEEGK